jgi:acyl carrier protein
VSNVKGIRVIDTSTLAVVRAAVIETLGLQDREGTIIEGTLLFGSMPELDSLALVELITALEERFGFQMDEADITADVFESVGSLAMHIDSQLE